MREKLGGRVNGRSRDASRRSRRRSPRPQAQVQVSQAQVETTRAQLENAQVGPVADDRPRAGQRHDGERDAPARLLRRRHAVQRGHDVRRQRVPDLRAVRPERAAPGRAGQRSRDHARHLSRAASSRRTWTRSSGRRGRDSSRPPATCRRPTFVPPPGRFPVKLVVGDADKAVFLAAGARGAAAIYTEHLTLVHIIRKVLLRVASYLDYIIIKHSISLGTDGDRDALAAARARRRWRPGRVRARGRSLAGDDRRAR